MQTDFRPDIDGFAFSNESWELTQSERNQIHALVVKELPKAVAIVTPILLAASPVILGILGPALIIAGPLLPILLPILIKKAINKISDTIASDATTWCGGIAFTAMDYYLLNWVLPRGNDGDSTDRPPGQGQNNANNASEVLQAYLWSRLVDCQLACLAQAIVWHFMLILMKDFGRSYIRKETKAAAEKVGQSIAAGIPCCMYLLNMSDDPSVDHVVIATGYVESSANVWQIPIYDVDLPDDTTQYLVIDATQSPVSIKEPNRKDGGNIRQWAGMFVAPYMPKQPQPAVVLDSHLKMNPPGFDGVDRVFTATFQALNQGYNTTLAMKPCLFCTEQNQLSIFADEDPANTHDEGTAFVPNAPIQLSFSEPGVVLLTPKVEVWPPSDSTKPGPPVFKSLPYYDGKLASPQEYRITPKIPIKGVNVPLDGCAPVFVEGQNVSLIADIEPVISIGVSGYKWTLSGAVTLSSTAASPLIQNLPAAGSHVHVDVVVSLIDGTAAYGALDFTVMSTSAAAQMTKLCHLFRQVEGQIGFPGTPVSGPAVDPLPWITVLNAFHGNDAEQFLNELTSITRSLTKLLEQDR